MNRKTMLMIGITTVWLAVLGGLAISAQNKYTVKVPGGLAFSDFKGYENWQFVSMSQTDDRLKAILANPTRTTTVLSELSALGVKLSIDDGSKIAKVQWKPKKSTEAPFVVNVPDTLADLFFIEKDSKRFPDSGGWDTPSLTMTPSPTHTRPIRPAPQLRTRVPYGREGKGLHFPPGTRSGERTGPFRIDCSLPGRATVKQLAGSFSRTGGDARHANAWAAPPTEIEGQTFESRPRTP